MQRHGPLAGRLGGCSAQRGAAGDRYLGVDFRGHQGQSGKATRALPPPLLHDVVEDTPTTLEDLDRRLWRGSGPAGGRRDQADQDPVLQHRGLQAENLRKMLLAMSRDVRVMIIKLCDRLHNMRTGDACPEQKRRDKARETMEVYAPIANRLGILNVKEELEDRLARVSGVIELRLKESGIEGATIKRRVKSVYGIYRKTIMQNKSFDEIYDIYAVRVILDTLAECYSTLGLIHDMYHPLPNRFKDYISTPPSPTATRACTPPSSATRASPLRCRSAPARWMNRQSTALPPTGSTKEGLDGHDKLDERLAWVRQLLESQRVSEDSGNLLHDLKSDLLPRRSLPLPQRAMSSTCPRVPPASTLPMPSTPPFWRVHPQAAAVSTPSPA